MKRFLPIAVAIVMCPLIPYAMQFASSWSDCLDCGVERGFPVHYMKSGTYGTVGRTLWFGWFVDVAVSFAISCSIVWVFSRFKKSK